MQAISSDPVVRKSKFEWHTGTFKVPARTTAVFIAPYFFLSGLGGELADRYDKALVAQRLKFAEIGVVLLMLRTWSHCPAKFWTSASARGSASIRRT